MVEVDTSEVGVRAVLSQKSPHDNKLHPWAYYSHVVGIRNHTYRGGNQPSDIFFNRRLNLKVDQFWQHC